MSKPSYEQAYEDHRYLWDTYGPADDMTGGYVDQDDLDKLLKSPTKATARACLINQIEYWFQVGPERGGGITRHFGAPGAGEIASDARVLEIADRYDCELPL